MRVKEGSGGGDGDGKQMRERRRQRDLADPTLATVTISRSTRGMNYCPSGESDRVLLETAVSKCGIKSEKFLKFSLEPEDADGGQAAIPGSSRLSE